MKDKDNSASHRFGLLILVLTLCPALFYIAFPLSGVAGFPDLRPAYLTVPAMILFMLAASLLPRGRVSRFSWRSRLASLSLISMTCYYIVWVFYYMGRGGSLMVFLLFLFPVLSMLFASFDRKSIGAALCSVVSGLLFAISILI